MTLLRRMRLSAPMGDPSTGAGELAVDLPWGAVHDSAKPRNRTVFLPRHSALASFN